MLLISRNEIRHLKITKVLENFGFWGSRTPLKKFLGTPLNRKIVLNMFQERCRIRQDRPEEGRRSQKEKETKEGRGKRRKKEKEEKER
jgi:hypothetical protein